MTKRQKQYLYVHALIVNHFNATVASSITGVSRDRASQWCREPKFREMVLHIQEMKKDFVEGSLMGLVAQGDSAAVIFANKTLNSDRGYNPSKKLEVTGSIEHSHSVSWDTVLEMLPIATRKEVLKAIARAENGDAPQIKQLNAHGYEEEKILIEDAEITLKENAAKEKEYEDAEG